jgi:hypothetical protein
MIDLAAALDAASDGAEPDASRAFASKALLLLSINVALAIRAFVYWQTMRYVDVMPAFLDPGWPWALLFGRCCWWRWCCWRGVGSVAARARIS